MTHPQDTPSAPNPDDRIRRPWGWMALAAGVTAILILLLTGEMVRAGQIFRWDDALLQALRNPAHPQQPIGPGWLTTVMFDLTALGSATILVLLVLLGTGVLMIRGLWLLSALLFVGTFGGRIIVLIAKSCFARTRPAIVPHLTEETSYSFPSAHAANGAITYLLLALILVHLTRNAPLRRFILLVSGMLIAVIGFSRVYLGVHYPSDVLAGWSFGVAWAVGCWCLSRWPATRP